MSRALILASVGLALLVGGCRSGPTGNADDDGEITDPSRPVALAWVGLYRGTGEGTAGDETWEDDEAVLRIAFDADSVKDTACGSCVTVTLDTVFARANLFVNDPVEVAFAYTEAGVIRELALQRLSGGGTGNLVVGNLRVERASDGVELRRGTYFLEVR